ncbi:MAG: zinc ribbon domain-containing protein [Xanthomonadales bacterium]|nr:zinc ribbon domain-containing protein [Xanthomonadales bacterium]
MPIYEYRCESCGHELEKLQRISEEPLTDCPACAESSLRRLISPAGFRLKGSGWYETDFKKDKKRNVVEKASEESGKSDKKEETSKSDDAKTTEKTKTETKPADKGSKASAA